MKIAFITNSRAPYRSLQMNEYAENRKISLSVYYTNKPEDNRPWYTTKNNNFNEYDLRGIKISKKYGYVNAGLINIVKYNDIVMMGGYEQPSIILLSILCKIYQKPYVIFFDGISCTKLNNTKKDIIYLLKKNIIKGSKFIMANGSIGEKYFTEIFEYPKEKIYNQYLSVNNNQIDKLFKNHHHYRENLRKKMGIDENKKVLMYSGRLIGIKNVKSVITAISLLNREDIVFLIVGGGELETDLIKYAFELNVEIIITGFISNQEELFKYYHTADAMILASVEEPWGLVVNEAMASGLPVIVSSVCGCSLDLVKKQNGYIIDPYDIKNISETIEKLLYEDNTINMGLQSRKIIKVWNFKNSKKSFEQLLSRLQLKDETNE